MRFSQRKNLTPIRVDVQRDSIDDALRNKLWSALQLALFDVDPSVLSIRGIDTELLARRIWLHFFHKPIDNTPEYRYGGFRAAVRQWFFSCEWYEVYDFLPAIYDELKGDVKESFVDMTNSFLESEMSAYRLVSGEIAEITSGEEIQAIEEALASTNSSPVRTHLRAALAKLTDRKSPDFRNSIKESISAVEAMCQAITATPRATLGQAIKRLKDAGVRLHPSLVVFSPSVA